MREGLVCGTLQEQKVDAIALASAHGHTLSGFLQIGTTHVAHCLNCPATVTVYKSRKNGKVKQQEAHKAGAVLYSRCPTPSPEERCRRTVQRAMADNNERELRKALSLYRASRLNTMDPKDVARLDDLIEQTLKEIRAVARQLA